MGRYYPPNQRKLIRENTHWLSVYDLHRYGTFNTFSSGTITWSDGSTITHKTYAWGDNPSMVLEYVISGGNFQEIMKYEIPLTTTHCYYGGVRWWFRCPRCNYRAGVLYKTSGGVFMCRHCNRLSYASRNENWRNKTYYLIRLIVMSVRRKKLWNGGKYLHYSGKPTMRYKKLQSIANSMVMSKKELDGLGGPLD